jgi:superkiller protein 3
MGILTNDDGLIDAALSEILALPIEQKDKLDPQRHVDYLLIQHHLAQVCNAPWSLPLRVFCSV